MHEVQGLALTIDAATSAAALPHSHFWHDPMLDTWRIALIRFASSIGPA